MEGESRKDANASSQSVEYPHLVDRSVKALFRECPDAILRLAGIPAAKETVRFEDANLNLPELRADHVCILASDTEGVPPRAVYLEYQLKPNPDLLPSWCAKWGGLTRQLGMPVLLLVLYLEKGDRAAFPDHYAAEVGGLETKLTFPVICLWEHEGRIRSGELPELAPLLLLCEETPTEATVAEEVELIHRSGLPKETQAELLGLALLLAMRWFARETLLPIFQEDTTMLKGIDILEDIFADSPLKEKWIAEGEARGLAEGEVEATRKMTLQFLQRKFGELPKALRQRIATSEAAWCQNLFDKAISAATLEELNIET